MNSTNKDLWRRVLHPACWVVAVLACLSGGALMAQPTVNGLFYGDGDDGRYEPYATSYGGSVLYSYYDAPSTTLYVALVVNHAINDLVCSPKSNKAYTESAIPTWGGHRSCKRASDSEFAAFTFECAAGSPKSWTWQQAVGCATTLGPPPSNWVSEPNPPCGASTAPDTWPPGINASTSWVANVNTYQNASTPRGWNLYTFGTDISNWKSPFVSTAPNDVTQVPGYPTYSGSNREWEWSMVYEWSLDIGPTGVDCGNQPIFFVTGASHHSPIKTQPPECMAEDDCFPPPTGDPTLSDFGDLPDTYSTTKASGGARHYLKVSGPYLGQAIRGEQDGVPTADASGDGDEEDGVTANVTGNWTPGSTQMFTVVVANAGSGARLGGWFDWNGDGDFTDSGEFVSWNVGNGTNTLNVTVGADFDWQTDDLYARFRLFSSDAAAPGGTLDQSDYAGTGTDGEVEDYRYAAGSLPVTLNAFATDGAPGREVTIRWQTASETENVAFELWGQVNGKWEVLSDLIASQRGSSALPQSYETRIEAPVGLTAIRLVDYDTGGRVETFGSFRLGGTYGEFQPVETIDWTGPRAEREAGLQELGFADTAQNRASDYAWLRAGNRFGQTTAATARWKKLRSGKPVTAQASWQHGDNRLAVGIDSRESDPRTVEIETGPLTHVAVTTTGIHRITYEALRDGGLDLAGADTRDIAVSWRGNPVDRWIEGPKHFGPGSAIEFLGRAPEGEDALYIDANLYQVSVDPARARSTAVSGHEIGFRGWSRTKSQAGRISAWYLEETWVDRPLFYHHQSPTGDPWVDQGVLAQGGRPASVVSLDLPVEGPVSEALSHLVVHLGTITDLPDLRDRNGQVLPEHNVEVWLRRPDDSLTYITTASTSGQRHWRIEAPLPAGLLQPGLNGLELRFSTDYLFSLVVVDRYGVLYPTSYRGPRLDFRPDRLASRYRIDGFLTPSVAAYAEGEDGSLTRVRLRVTPSGGSYTVDFRRTNAERFWVTEAPFVPAVFTTQAPDDLLAHPSDLVVIAGSNFMGSEALADYLDQRAAFHPVVVDVEDIYNAVGFGMAVPSAIRDYLAARNAVHPFSHVQLVGADCYDRLNYVSDCVSYLPLPTARVGASFYTPGQNRLVDLDGDAIGDKAVGQFSVREEAELATIVRKGAAWEVTGPSAGGSALLVAEETDGAHNFEEQIERLAGQLGWDVADMLRMAEHPDIETAREALRSALEAGRSVTTFSGHSSPVVWAFRALLTPAIVASLANEGRPTIMVPLACETTYDISPEANVLGHQLLFAGDQGALAISGAAALANLTHNELMATHVLNGLKAGLTLGEAVLVGRQALGSSYQELQDNWITQGDVAVALVP